MPILILFEFIGQAGTRADEAHFAAKHVEKLRQLIEARSAEKFAYRRHPRVVSDLFDTPQVTRL